MYRSFLTALALSLGFALPAPAAESSGWNALCPAGQPCFIEHLSNAQAGKPAQLHVRFDRQADKGLTRLILIAPLGIFLPQGVQLSVDGSKTITLPFLSCSADGCEASAVLDADALHQFAGGKMLAVRYAVGQGPVDISVGLAGMAATLDSLPR